MGLSAPAPLGRRRRRGGAFRVPQLFANGEAGAWYDPSDLTAEKVAWRRNLLTWSEGFANTAWVASAGVTVTHGITDPNGGTTAARLVSDGTVLQTFRQSITQEVGVPYTVSLWVRATTAGVNNQFRLILDGGAQNTVVNATESWVRYNFTASPTTGGIRTVGVLSNIPGSVYDIQIAFAQFERGTTATAYQRITDFTSDFLAAFPTHTLYQDSAGTTPVTALGQPVGRVLDTSGRGNHAIQATSASRPLLDGRVNLLTFSEQFDNAVWTVHAIGLTVSANNAVGPDGATTADRIVETATTGLHVTQQQVAITAGATYRIAVFAKAAERTIVQIATQLGGWGTNFYANFDLANGTAHNQTAASATIQPFGNGWYLCAITATSAGAGSPNISFGPVLSTSSGVFPTYAGSTSNGLLLVGADFRLASDAAYPYQRVAAATDYADVGVPRSFLFDGFDDSLYTASNMDLSGTDKVTMLAGVRKLSDGGAGMIVELSANGDSNNGAFYVSASPSGQPAYATAVRGTSLGYYVPVTYTAPTTNVVAVLADIGASTLATEIVPRINGVVDQDGGVGSVGTGNFGSYVLFIGRRNNASLPFNGKAYQLIVRGALTDAATLVQAERFVAQRTGITL